ncbi:hypothetical protein ACMX2M_16990 [Paenibacillus polymyxa]
MKLLLDTITFNSYASYSENKYSHSLPNNMNIKPLVKFLGRNTGSMVLHSATLYELLIKCIKNKNIQAPFSPNNQVSIKQFFDDYNFMSRKKIQIANDTTCYFDINPLRDYYQKNTSISMDYYISQKISYETYHIGFFYSLVIIICGDFLFEKYGDTVDENLFYNFMNSLTLFMEHKIKSLLEEYYYNEQQKDFSKKALDSTLYFVLTQFEKCIEQKSTLNLNAEGVIDFLASLLKTLNIKDLDDGAGVNKAHEIFSPITNPTFIKKLINEKVNSVMDEMINNNRPSLSKTEIRYLTYLLEKLFLNKYKITKNDFSDFLILSSCDLLSEKEDVVFITFDTRLKKFIEENKIYYDEAIYKLFYIEK